MKVLFIFGTRPEAIKTAPLVLAFQDDPFFDCRVCVTAQHRQMLDQVLELFGIIPDHDLDLMRANQDLSDLTGRILSGLKQVLDKEQPDLVIVQGDTTTCFAGALASFYQHIPVAHLEAGLRTGNILAPFPEEANRAMTSRLARFHFAPTERSRQNLLKENIPEKQIWVTGNSVIDALLWVREKVKDQQDWPDVFGSAEKVIQAGRPYVLITGHRRENFGQGFRNLCRAVATLAENHPDVHFIYPVHLNPNVRQPVYSLLKEKNNIHLIQPLDYAPFVHAMDRALLILTDSGGVQEEAPSLGKPVLVMRDTTERPEAIEAGTVILVGTDRQRIIMETERLLRDPQQYREMSRRHNPYGDGRTSIRIKEILQTTTIS